jgi:hypothetical protein
MDEEVVAPKTWYVYTYAFPDGTVFYVGKGVRARIEEHEREAQSGCDCEKCRTIRRIWKSGMPVQKRIVYGLENLTNRNSGVLYQRGRPTGIDEESPRLTLKEWRVQAGLSILDLAELSGVKYFTVSRMEDGKAVSSHVANRVLRILSSRLGRRVVAEQVDQLRIEDRTPLEE